MKTRAVIVMALVAACLGAAPNAQADKVRADPRVELIGILFHLAGASEYASNKFPAYTAAVDRWFEPFRQHAAVEATKKVMAEQRARFFHPMNLAVHLTMPPALAERTPFDQSGHALGTRWPAAPTRAYLETVRAFYRDADVEGFFRSQAASSAMTIDSLRTVLQQHGDPGWFLSYFGVSRGTDFFVVPGPINGGAQYGPTYRSSRGEEEAYAVIGIYKLDAAGLPRFDRDDADNVVHEFAHTLTNRAVAARLPELEAAGTAMFLRVQDKMRQQSYGEWQTLMYETVVRAVVVRFIAAHRGVADAQKEIDAQHQAGFVAVGALAALLEDYEQSRAKYPAFTDLMPRVVDVLRKLAT